MNKQRYIAPQMECMQIRFEGLLAASSLQIDENTVISSETNIYSQDKELDVEGTYWE